MGPVLPKRTSLEVPDDSPMGLSHPADGSFGGFLNGGPSSFVVPPADPQVAKVENESLLEKRNSLGRSGARFSSGRRVTPASTATRTVTPPPGQQPGGQENSTPTRGVNLVDAPMDY